jgi:hypothetical protein
MKQSSIWEFFFFYIHLPAVLGVKRQKLKLNRFQIYQINMTKPEADLKYEICLRIIII